MSGEEYQKYTDAVRAREAERTETVARIFDAYLDEIVPKVEAVLKLSGMPLAPNQPDALEWRSWAVIDESVSAAELAREAKNFAQHAGGKGFLVSLEIYAPPEALDRYPWDQGLQRVNYVTLHWGVSEPIKQSSLKALETAVSAVLWPRLKPPPQVKPIHDERYSVSAEWQGPHFQMIVKDPQTFIHVPVADYGHPDYGKVSKEKHIAIDEFRAPFITRIAALAAKIEPLLLARREALHLVPMSGHFSNTYGAWIEDDARHASMITGDPSSATKNPQSRDVEALRAAHWQNFFRAGKGGVRIFMQGPLHFRRRYDHREASYTFVLQIDGRIRRSEMVALFSEIDPLFAEALGRLPEKRKPFWQRWFPRRTRTRS